MQQRVKIGGSSWMHASFKAQTFANRLPFLEVYRETIKPMCSTEKYAVIYMKAFFNYKEKYIYIYNTSMNSVRIRRDMEGRGSCFS